MGTSIRYLVVSVCLFSWKHSANDHFWSFSLGWLPCPRLSLIGPESVKLRVWYVPCLTKAKNFRFALGEMEAKEHLNRISRNPTETVLASRKPKMIPSAHSFSELLRKKTKELGDARSDTRTRTGRASKRKRNGF